MDKRTIRTIESVVLATVFLAAISLPSIGLLLRWHVMTEQEENRKLAAFPMVTASRDTLAKFPDSFTAYFNDNFGFRPILIHAQAFARMRLLGISPSPLVILGKDGWLFFASEYSAAGEHQVPPFSDKQLEDWKRAFETRHDALARKGILYVFAVVPRKETIYPEFLPKGYNEQGESRLNQLIAYLQKNSRVQILDLQPALLSAKTRHVVSYKTDTHWNFYGALAGYQRIMLALQPWFADLQPVSENDCDAVTVRINTDLSTMMGLSSYLKEDIMALHVRDAQFRVVDEKKFFGWGQEAVIFTAEGKNPKLPRAVMFGDSNSNSLRAFLPQNFSRFVLISNSHFDQKLVDSEHPKVVIQEIGELLLMLDQIAGAGPP